MPTSKIPSRPSAPERGSEPSSVNLGDLPVPVHSGREPQIVEGELDSQPNGSNHGLNPIEMSNRSSETKSRWRWKQAREILEEI